MVGQSDLLTRDRKVSSGTPKRDFVSSAIDSPEKAEDVRRALMHFDMTNMMNQVSPGIRIFTISQPSDFPKAVQSLDGKSEIDGKDKGRESGAEAVESEGARIVEIHEMTKDDDEVKPAVEESGQEDSKKKNKKRKKKTKNKKKGCRGGSDGGSGEQEVTEESEGVPSSSSSSTDHASDRSIVLGERNPQLGNERLESPIGINDDVDFVRDRNDNFVNGDRDFTSYDMDDTTGLRAFPMSQQDSTDTYTSTYTSERLATPPAPPMDDLPENIPSIMIQSPVDDLRSSRSVCVADPDSAEVTSEAKPVEIIIPTDPITPAVVPINLPLRFGDFSPTSLDSEQLLSDNSQYKQNITVRLPQSDLANHTSPISHQPSPAPTNSFQHPIASHIASHENPNTLQLSNAWTMLFSNSSKTSSLHKAPSLSSVPRLVPATSTAETYSHGLIRLFTSSTVEDLLGSYKALRRAIAQSKNRPIEPVGASILKAERGLGIHFMGEDDNFHFFAQGVKPMWEDPMCAKGGKMMLTGPIAVLDAIFLDLILKLIGGDFDWTTFSPLHPLSNPQVIGIVLSRRERTTRIEIWSSGGLGVPPPPEFISFVTSKVEKAFGGCKFYAYKSFSGR